MTLDNLIKKLENIKVEYGGSLDVITSGKNELHWIEIQRYATFNSDYHEGIIRETDDLDGDYLECWTKDEKYNKNLIEQGLCVKIY